jgi:hypothetical protein
MIRFAKAFLIAGTMLALGAVPARAGFIPVLTSPPPGGAASTFTYDLVFGASGAETLTAGNFATLVGFGPGITPASVSISGPTGLAASFSTPNLTFTYSGPTLTADTTWTATILLDGLFTTGTGTLPVAVTEPRSIVLGAVALPFLFFLRRRWTSRPAGLLPRARTEGRTIRSRISLT